jgi:hypothetical protein
MSEYTLLPHAAGGYRTISSRPAALRWARTKSDGGFIHDELQAGYEWSDGTTGGIEWRAIEVVEIERSSQP